MREILIKLGASVVLCVLATWILFLTPVSQKTSTAQAVTTLNTTWTATGFLKATAFPEGGNALGPVALGVVKWHNVTKESNEVVYEEDWSADLPNDGESFVINSSSDTPTVILPGSYSQARFDASWLYNGGSMHLTAARPITFSFANDVGTQTPVKKVGRADFRAIGNAMACYRGGNATCLYATGSYGYNITENLGDGVSENLDNFGALIPIKWTVTGKVY